MRGFITNVIVLGSIEIITRHLIILATVHALLLSSLSSSSSLLSYTDKVVYNRGEVCSIHYIQLVTREKKEKQTLTHTLTHTHARTHILLSHRFIHRDINSMLTSQIIHRNATSLIINDECLLNDIGEVKKKNHTHSFIRVGRKKRNMRKNECQ